MGVSTDWTGDKSNCDAMKLNLPRQKNVALTAFEVMIVVACILFLAALLLPILEVRKDRVGRINCVSNLRQINIAFLIWEGDNSNEYPMSVSVTNGGARELMEAGDLAECFRVTSNELSNERILVCPSDRGRTFARDWSALNNSNISYFLSADAIEAFPARVLDGDANLAIGGSLSKRGLLEFASNSPVAWSGTRHGPECNIGFVDGSVDMEFSSGLRRAFQQPGLATNRLAMP